MITTVLRIGICGAQTVSIIAITGYPLPLVVLLQNLQNKRDKSGPRVEKAVKVLIFKELEIANSSFYVAWSREPGVNWERTFAAEEVILCLRRRPNAGLRLGFPVSFNSYSRCQANGATKLLKLRLVWDLSDQRRVGICSHNPLLICGYCRGWVTKFQQGCLNVRDRGSVSLANRVEEYHFSVPKYSIVVPFHNEEENVTALYDRLKAVMEHVGESFELVLVDDGSRTAPTAAGGDCCGRLAACWSSNCAGTLARPRRWRQDSTMRRANSSWRWMATCSTIRMRFPASWRSWKRAMTLSADGASNG